MRRVPKVRALVMGFTVLTASLFAATSVSLASSVTVNTYSELKNAIASASSGDVIQIGASIR